ncbi:MAG TPA: DJ-1/PfpI family protein [Pedobacter sp.]|jgi:putative intracellular protease/amidase
MNIYKFFMPFLTSPIPLGRPGKYKFTFYLLVAFASLTSAQTAKETFVCSPCGRDCDKLIFDKPGICSECHMELVAKTVDKKKAGRVTILLFEGVQIIDFTAPFEVLGQAGYEVITVAADSSIKTNMGMRVIPDFTFKNCPEASIFIIPGGNISATRESHEAIQWIKGYSEKADVVMSVCNGALILATTGLLEGLTATCNFNGIAELTTNYPNIKVVSDQRFVDNGKFITTAGLSSGMDGALHIIEKLKGRPKAQTVSLNIEYDWKPKNDYARAALADRYLNPIFQGNDKAHPGISSAKLLNTEGDKDHWQIEYEVTATISAVEIEKALEERVDKQVDWKKKNNYPTNSSWSFISKEKENWNGFVEVRPIASANNKFLVTFKVDKGN